VAQFLASDALLPDSVVVVSPIEIAVVQLGVTAYDVIIGINGDPGETEPAVLTISEVADPHLPVRGFALPANLRRGCTSFFYHAENA